MEGLARVGNKSQPRERPDQEGGAVESGISQKITTEGKGRRQVSINLGKIFHHVNYYHS